MGRIKSDPPPRTQRADVPESLERLLRQAMAKDPAARPQTALDLIRGLQTIEQELRLPLTQPILPADEPSGDTRGGDTIARPLARGGENTFSAHRPASGPTGTPMAGAAAEGAWGPAPATPTRARRVARRRAPTLRRLYPVRLTQPPRPDSSPGARRSRPGAPARTR